MPKQFAISTKERLPTTCIPLWSTTKTNHFQQCHPWRIRQQNLQVLQRRERTLSDCLYAHSCWTPGCHGSHPGKGCQSTPNELSWALTPLRHSQFECELAGHPEKAWVSKMLTAIKVEVCIGHTGPDTTHMHATCLQYSGYINEQLHKNKGKK